MVKRRQDFTIVQGTHVQQPIDVSLDQNRVLDGTESWTLTIRKEKTDDTARLTMTKAAGDIVLEANTYKPIAAFTPSHTPIAKFPASNTDERYFFDVMMTKDGKTEPTTDGHVTVITPVTQ